MKFDNYLPYTDGTGKSVGSWNGMGGELPLPVDETIPGGGPVLKADGTPALDQNGKPIKMGQNRVSVHWHGGDTPWTGDGTPHEWFAPRGDISYTLGIDAVHPNGMGKGESAANVSDMADPGPGSYTLYFPNNLSGRMMFYHDHASGLTRVNVYEGMAAGYVVVDPTEQVLVAGALGILPTATVNGVRTGLLDTIGIPLVLQDKGFVPNNIGPNAVASDGTPASQDSKWDLFHWGQPGDFFFPHVYETNQDPNAIDGTNPVGRWDWGPWFWPVFPAQYSLPTGAYGDVTTTPESFMDTALVNGQVYPTMTVDPKTYRLRILSVPNDRSTNLSIYQAADYKGVVCDANNKAPALAPAAPGGLPPVACTEVRMVPASPTAGFPATWPTDGRSGGVPDPATMGPDIVQIGNEAGLLPAPAIWKAQPITYDQNVRNVTVFNVLNHGLLLGGAERADVLVDFSNYAGQTLILYNDAPAPMPGFDPRIDYFTGDGDQTAGGGAYNTLPGYGPNTRTFLQIKVNATNTSGTGGPLNTASLAAALPVAYAATQPAPLIPEAVYNAPFATNDGNHYAQIGTGANAAPYFFVGSGTTFALTGVTMVSGGSLYPPATTAKFSAPTCTPQGTVTCATATATPVIGAGGIITGITNFVPGAGYSAPASVTFSAFGTDGTRAVALVTANGMQVRNKAIQELFDPLYGRMNATLAAELPFSTATVATTIPLAYIDTPIEYLDAISDGETQIWKITHNGVDSHPVHFHLFNVQVINRVGWDGTVKPPDANEVGWKETLRMNPLEDVYIAARAVHPAVPFGLPTSSRLLDPSQAQGATLGFTNIDPTTGNAPTTQTYLVNGVSTAVPVAGTYSNQLTSFDNEYVWHCHILGHEEFDFMRPMIFHPTVVRPDAPGAVTVSGSTVSWTDPTPFGGQDSQGIPTAGSNTAFPITTSSPKNEIGFKVYDAANNLLATVPANVTSWTDSTGALNLAGATVIAYNAAGGSVAGTLTTATSGTSTTTPPPAPTPVNPGPVPVLPTQPASAAPVGLTQTLNSNGTVTLSWTAVPGATSYKVTLVETTGGVPPAVLAPVTTIINGMPAAGVTPALPPATTYTTAVLNSGSTYAFAVNAQTLSGATVAATAGLGNSPTAAPVAFAGAAGTAPGSITLVWANNALNKNNVAGLLLTWTTGGKAASTTFAPTSTGATVVGMTPGVAYAFTLQAVSNVASFSSTLVSLPAAIAAP
jgi:FtsP/CotA-like multicopper oxidase with cupredoxin domain